MENEIYSNIKDRMIKTVEHYNHEVAIIRTGRASADVLDSVKVDYYGTMSPLKNIAHVSVPEAQSILIQPFDPSSLEAIEKAIVTSDLGLSPNNDGNLIRLNIPALTEERRKDLVRVVHKTIEEGRIGIRNLRREANEQLKELEIKTASLFAILSVTTLIYSLLNSKLTFLSFIFLTKVIKNLYFYMALLMDNFYITIL